MPETAPLATVLRLLRLRAEGGTLDAPPANVVPALRLSLELGVGAPVAEALAPALPAPAAAALTAPILAEARRRAEIAAEQLATLGPALEAAGVPAIALKGAAFAAAAGAPVPWRDMIDLDLLVPRAALSRAVQALGALGYAGEHAAHVATDYHYPVLLPPGPGLGVELHVALGWRGVAPLAGLAARARPAALPGLRVPAPDDRLAHLVHHAQIADLGHARRVARLRDALDWCALAGPGGAGAEPAAVRARFAACGREPAFDAFHAFAAAVWRMPGPADAAARAWAEDAMATLADPGLAARRRRLGLGARLRETLASPRLLAHLAAAALNPRRLARMVRGRLPGGGGADPGF